MYNIYCLFFLTVAYGLGAVSSQDGPALGCVLPEYPKNGIYTVFNKPDATPGQSFDTVVLSLTCNDGYRVLGTTITACSNNTWSQTLPECTRFCKLTPHTSVTYYCKVTGEHQLSGRRLCNEYEPSGTVVVPECKRPIYYYSGVLLNMRCIDGSWDHIAVCQPDCGTPTPEGEQLLTNGVSAKRGELPWHAGIYLKPFTPYMQICGGSLVSRTVVISAAHCFWTDGLGLQSFQHYAVALGKIYRPWDDRNNPDVHKSNVSDIRVPVRYMGEQGNYQDDIALVIMSTPVVYVTYIRPVCINFDVDFDNRQLQSSNLGKVVGWGLTEEDGINGSSTLKTAEIPYVDLKKCILDLPYSFRAHITSDKICAGYKNGNTNLCKGDSGGGLVFPDTDRGIQRYYLRGVVSTAPTNGHRCNVHTYTSFTHVLKHAAFITENGLGPDGRQSSPISCDINPEAAHCVSRHTDWPGGNGQSGQVVSRDSDQGATLVFGENPPSEYDKQPIAAVRDVVKSFFGKMSNVCILPAYPAHGTYTVDNRPEAIPGQAYDLAILTVICDPGYGVIGNNATYCFNNNNWQQPMPQCTRFCRLTPDPSVKYFCKVSGDGILSGTRVCEDLEPHGTVVIPECNRPVYYSKDVLLNMRCFEGSWDHIAVCQPDCGTSTAKGEELIVNGTKAEHGDFPWHAAIYDKSYTPFMQICSGSLVSTKVVISAANCFWTDAEKLQSPSKYAVALGKIYRPWDDPNDNYTQKSDVSSIRIPVRYMGDEGHLQDDIALVILSTPMVYLTYIRPVCIDFDIDFDKRQLQPGNMGKVSGWGLTSVDGTPSQVLLLTELPYVDPGKCIAELPSEFRAYFTSDKICAGTMNGTTLCKDDSGGGLAFPIKDGSGTQRYYLRGVVSTAPKNGHLCNANAYTSFTHVQQHDTFIKEHLYNDF